MAITKSLWRLVLTVAFGSASLSLAVEGERSGLALREYRQAEIRCQSQPREVDAAWRFARACFDLAEFATNNVERAAIAEQGIAASRKALERDSNSVPAHYYLGMNLGQLARTRGLGALKLVRQMERVFNDARRLDERFDYAGPDRNLGLLYRDAPALGSIGSRVKAHQHLDQAVLLAPDYPENRLNLLEGNLKWRDYTGARCQLKALEDLWPAARAQFSGPAWASSWVNWEVRLQKARKKLEEPAQLESPRH